MLLLCTGATAVVVALMSYAARGYAHDSFFYRDWIVRSDTDTTVVSLDSLEGAELDSTLSDSLAPDTGRASLYFPSFRRDRPIASLFARERPFAPRLGSYWRHEIKLDSTGRHYIAREAVGNADVRYPLRLDLPSYREARLARDLQNNWISLIEQQSRMRQQQQSRGLGFNIMVPGGRTSAFSTIFGKPQVDLRVTGQAYIQAGFDYRKSDQQVAYTGRASRTDPTFKQDLSLGITGTIGDKLRVDVSWDTKNQFDYQNQLKLQYTGYEDEIIQNIEAGNVFLPTPSTLIRGGQSLFGIKSEFQIGGVRVTTVASQQEGQSNSLSIEGGSQAVEFALRPTDYDEAKHFFLGYYFRNRWEDALSDPPNYRVAQGFEGIKDIEVWRLQPTSPEEANVRHIVALVDLGEPQEILTLADQYTEQRLPDESIDQYLPEELQNDIAAGTANTDTYLKSVKGLESHDYQIGRFKLLTEGRDYFLDPVLGYISLSQSLPDNQAIAVSYRYVANGQSYQVGTFSNETGGSTGSQNDDKLVVKLLRPINLKQPVPGALNPAAWYLEMRNIYSLGSRGINPNEFELKINYEPPGKTPSERLAGVGGTRTLLQILGLDRLNQDYAPQTDNRFDYLVNFTINPSQGLLIFPYLEPFGSHLASVIDNEGTPQAQANKNLYVFTSLYREKKENARRDTQRDVYSIRGSYKGAVNSHYDLGAYAGLVEGSVRVTSGGTPLNEGTDFIVDYTSGSVDIINPAFLTAGRDIQISYEQNQFLNLQKKTLLGARAEYQLDDRLTLGTTVMKLSQKSPVDKLRVGEEPVSNLIWGVDGRIDLEPRWLTRAIDALPFIQTRAPSSFMLTGEFAQLRPSHIETVAFERTRRDLGSIKRDFHNDELRGISYLDDFEGFETTYSLKQPGAWVLSAPPDSIGAIDPLAGDPETHLGTQWSFERSKWRGSLGWYQLNVNVLRELQSRGVPITEATDRVPTLEVYPNRDIEGTEADRYVSTLDLHFSPRERGPYNYTDNLPEFFRNPKLSWGGITQRIPEGYNDFNLKNIEFVEFIFKPFAENGENDAGPDAKLYVDLGSISEDIIPNEKLNSEDGLSTTTLSATSFDAARRSRLPQVQENNAVDINDETRRTEDLGFDGLASYDPERYEDETGYASEREVFKEFLAGLDRDFSAISDPLYQAEIEKARRDPSGDDYYSYLDNIFDDTALYPNRGSIQQRFSRYFAGSELNSYEGQSRLAVRNSERLGNSRYPDSEDLNLNYTVDTDNSYFQYEIPLSRSILSQQADPNSLDDYVVTEIKSGDVGTGWYHVRIPVRKYTRKAGTIQDFDLIESIRIWITGTEVPVTARFASLELVGSQWQKSTEIPLEPEIEGGLLPDTTGRITMSSINNEEHGNLYSPPMGTIISQTRLASGDLQRAREQAMVLTVEDLFPGRQLAIFKTFQGYDLLKYEKMRMFVHMHGTTADGRDLVELAETNIDEARSKARLFIRFGANERNDYYEYEQPLTPGPYPQTTDILRRPPDEVDKLWRTNQLYNGEVIDLNSVVIHLGAFNQLKVARDNYIINENFAPDSVFWNTDENGLQRSGAPNPEEFAPPGTRISIKGSPSLAKVNTIVIGIRNPADPNSMDPADVLDYVEVWVNELRVSGYDEHNGWAALLNTDLRLADFGRIKASFQQQTEGFGDLSSTLDEREQQEFLNWGVNAEVNLDKFLPERYGWSLPVSMQVQSNTTTPSFSPTRGDVRLQEILDGIDEQDVDLATKEQLKQEAIQAAQTSTNNRSITARIGKQGSKSRLIRNTLDGLTVSYSFSDSKARNPSLQMNDSWRWQGTVNYRFASRRPRTLRPFWFLDPIPVLGMLADLRFNYMPQALTATGMAARNFNQQQERPIQTIAQRDSSQVQVPDLVEYKIREQHQFTHKRQYSLQYNPFQFLNLSFDANTDQSFNAIGVDTLKSTILGIDSTEYEISRLSVIPTDRVLSRLFSGRMSPRTDRYGQRFTATFQPRFSQALSWVVIQPVTYNVTFSWQNGAAARNTGASVANALELRGGLTLRPQDFWRKFEFYRNLEEQQKRAESQAQAERQAKEQERQRRREQERLERERKKQEEALRKEREAAGDTTDVDVEDLAPEELLEGEEAREGRPLARPERAVPEAQDSSEVEEIERRRIKLPLPKPMAILRRTILAVTGINDITVTYSNSQTSNSSNVGLIAGPNQVNTYYSLYDAFRGYGPSLRYRFGLDRRIPANQRILSRDLQVSDDLSNTNKFQARTSLQPSQNLQITLNWNTDWSDKENVTYRTGEDGRISTTISEGGSNRSFVWAFNASYLDLFRRQFETFRGDFDKRVSPEEGIGDENGDGRVVLTNQSVVEDFQSAFMSSFGMFDSRNLLPIPMPQWSVTYSGISSWPIFRSLVQSASLRHNYGAEYSTDFRTQLASAGGTNSFDLGPYPIISTPARYTVGTIRINERYSPLIGLDLSWKNRLSTNISWNKSNAYSLSASDFSVSELRTDEIAVTMSYQRQGMRLPFMPRSKRLNNRISFSLMMALADNTDTRYQLRLALRDAVTRYGQGETDFRPEDALSGDNRSLLTDTRRLTVSPKISYQFSNQVSADFTLRYELFEGDNRIPSYTSVSGNFNVNVRISN